MSMKFTATSLFFNSSGPSSDETLTTQFDEESAPKWLCAGGLKGSTMDNRWFWNDHVLTLEVGQYVDTDFQRITRIS